MTWCGSGSSDCVPTPLALRVKLRRYRQLTDALAGMTCRNLVEVGTWNGLRAIELARAALRRNAAVTYHGFDLFEELTDEQLEAELSKRPPPRAEVEDRLRAFQEKVARRGRLLQSRRRSFDFHLHPGDTHESLPAFRERSSGFEADFVFIDGGHKIETIENDWAHTHPLISKRGAVFLDDYYGNQELAKEFGCNSLLERLRGDPSWQVELLPESDEIPDIGPIQIAKVTPSP
jgi:predicted O-methyltransferase YrrM